MNSIINDTDLSFEDGYQVIYFYITDMLFHKRMSNVFLNLEKKYKDVKFYSADVYIVKSFVKRFNLVEAPTICIFHNGKEKKRMSGIIMASALKSEFYNLMN